MRTILNLCTALAVFSLVVAVAGCGDSGDEPGVVVTATTTQLADLARNVAGERAEVDGLLSTSSDPHDYEPRPSDAEALIDADLILKSGGDVDAWLDQLVESAGSDAPELVLLDRVDQLEADGEVDPHWWQDPRNAVLAVDAIRDDLIAVDPDGRAQYERNAAAYVAEIERLDRGIAACIERVPESERKLVTSHDSLGYFANRYGIEVIGTAIPALTTQAQASAGETAELVDLIRDEDVTSVYPEAGVSSELEEAIAEEAGATVGEELWADTLGPEGSGGETYLGALASNAEAMVDGFGGECEL